MALRFGLFGTGYWARETDAAGILAHPDAELVGVWGRDPEKAHALARDVGARGYEDADALIDAVDAIAVALPPDVQAQIAERAATAGRHLLLDKPLAFTTEAADRVVAAVDRAGVRSVVFHTARFMPEVEAWLEAVRRAGDWHGGAVTLLASIFEEGNPFGASPWRRERGALWDVGPHALDFVLSTLGPIDGLVAARGREDAVHLVAHHASSAASTLSVSLTAPLAAQASDWWLYGPRGITRRPDGPTTPAEAFTRAISAVQAGGHPSDVHHGREIVRLLEAAAARLVLDGGVRGVAGG
jgi:predicted dehydrogenase